MSRSYGSRFSTGYGNVSASARQPSMLGNILIAGGIVALALLSIWAIRAMTL